VVQIRSKIPHFDVKMFRRNLYRQPPSQQVAEGLFVYVYTLLANMLFRTLFDVSLRGRIEVDTSVFNERLSKQLHHPRFSHNNWTKEPEGVIFEGSDHLENWVSKRPEITINAFPPGVALRN